MDRYLYYDAKDYAAKGKAVTYVLVDDDRTTIYAYATINAHSLSHYEPAEKYHTKECDQDGNILVSTPCCEIKMFAIAKNLRGQYPCNDDGTLREYKYSKAFFMMLLEELYYMSMKIIGFNMIFLRANHEGEKLYRESGFVDCEKYIQTYDIMAEGCKPMCLPFKELENQLFSDSYVQSVY